jgi:hypothetical protein
MVPSRMVRVASLGLVALMAGSCGGGTQRHATSNRTVTASPCVGRAHETACLGSLERLIAVRSIELSAQVPPRVTATCRAMARATRLKVVCPPVVPVGGVVNDPSLNGPQIVSRATYSASLNNGQNPGHIHWEFGATTNAVRRLWVFDRKNWAVPAPPARLIAARHYLGHLIVLYRFPDNDGQLEGHDAAFATEHGVSYFVSIHGHAHDDADIAMLLAIVLAQRGQ